MSTYIIMPIHLQKQQHRRTCPSWHKPHPDDSMLGQLILYIVHPGMHVQINLLDTSHCNLKATFTNRDDVKALKDHQELVLLGLVFDNTRVKYAW